jgi:hypothetical protein
MSGYLPPENLLATGRVDQEAKAGYDITTTTSSASIASDKHAAGLAATD